MFSQSADMDFCIRDGNYIPKEDVTEVQCIQKLCMFMQNLIKS